MHRKSVTLCSLQGSQNYTIFILFVIWKIRMILSHCSRITNLNIQAPKKEVPHTYSIVFLLFKVVWGVVFFLFPCFFIRMTFLFCLLQFYNSENCLRSWWKGLDITRIERTQLVVRFLITLDSLITSPTLEIH